MTAYETIASRANPKIRDAAALLRPAERKRTARFLLEGLRLCADAALNGVEIETCFVTEEALRRGGDRLDAVLLAARRTYLVSPEAADRLRDTKTPQGVFCVCAAPEAAAAISPEGFYLVAEGFQNPENLGAAARTAEALGAAGLLAAGGCDPYAPKAMRASMGALLRLPVMRFADGAAAVRALRGAGLRVYAAVPHEGAQDVTKLPRQRGAAVVIGSEGDGVRPETAAACDAAVRIPMRGRAESLNAAAAAAILMWEFLKD